MMFFYMTAMIAGMAIALYVLRAAHKFIEGRRIRNGLLALSVKELHDTIESILETPADVPDRLLALLDFMLVSAFDKDTPRSFSRIVASSDQERIAESKNNMDDTLVAMRPQLRELFLKAVASWLSIVCNSNPSYGEKIANAFMQMKISRSDVRLDEEREAFAVLRKFEKLRGSQDRSSHPIAC